MNVGTRRIDEILEEMNRADSEGTVRSGSCGVFLEDPVNQAIRIHLSRFHTGNPIENETTL